MYTKIDLNTWDRKDLFNLYTNDLKIVMNMTVDVDVTPVVSYAKEKGLKFYPVMIWLVSNVINANENFKLAFDENGDVIRWNYVSPSYTDFNVTTKKFNKFVTDYDKDLFVFYNRVQNDREKYKNEVGFLPNQPKNIFDISCLPWTKYKSLDLHVYNDGKQLFPVVIWGKYELSGDKYLMPVTANIHHAVCDGYNICKFFEDLQAEINKLK
ncbi:MAG: chloramphenicol acetyltransferase [Clostridia bacterium]|nr:chloramphenicol acetyltransferase [Clostridia bacterium]